MTGPLIVLAVFAIGLGFIGTPVWPWFQSYLEGHAASVEFGALARSETLSVMGLSAVIVAAGITAAWFLYGAKPPPNAHEPDPLERAQPAFFAVLQDKFYVDEFYETTVVRLNAWWARTCDWLDRVIWDGAVQLVSYLVLGIAWLNRFIDEYVVNLSFDEACKGVREGGGLLGRLQAGQVQSYLRAIGLAMAVLVLLLTWGCR